MEGKGGNRFAILCATSHRQEEGIANLLVWPLCPGPLRHPPFLFCAKPSMISPTKIPPATTASQFQPLKRVFLS